MIGVIKLTKFSEGYGFIATEQGEEFFFHCQQYSGDWEELCDRVNQAGPNEVTVIFKSMEHRKGPRAINVELVES